MTLIELLVVLAIISLLPALVAPALKNLDRHTRETICSTDTGSLVRASITYAANRFPSSHVAVAALLPRHPAVTN